MNAAAPDAAVLAAAAPEAVDRSRRQAEVVAALGAALPAHALLWRREDTVPYECDGLTAYREQPLVVALPETETQVAAVLAICHRLQVPDGEDASRHRAEDEWRCEPLRDPRPEHEDTGGTDQRAADRDRLVQREQQARQQ